MSRLGVALSGRSLAAPPCGPIALLSVAVALGGCLEWNGEVSAPPSNQSRVRTFQVPLFATNRFDILFVLDNSIDNTADGPVAGVASRVDRLLGPFEKVGAGGLFADLHIGVVTTDLGAGATGAPGCTPSGPQLGGDRARLQAIGSKAPPSCKPTVGPNWAAFQFGPSGESNLPPGQTLVQTLQCMMAVGSSGCGYRHPLEAAYAALHNDIAQNAGFLRDDAKLLIFFVTGGDDGSAPPDSDLFDPLLVRRYGYGASYSRQTRFGVECGNPPSLPPYDATHGPLPGCVPAPNPDGKGPGKLYDIRRYSDFFNMPRLTGGVKDSPTDVILFALTGPSAPFEVIIGDPSPPAGGPFPVCDHIDEAAIPPCVPKLQKSCINPRNPNLAGDPAVRLNALVKSTPRGHLASVCADDYGPALESAGSLLVATTRTCMPDRFPRDTDGKLLVNCIVQQLTLRPDGSESRVSLPRCSDSADNHPCWRVQTEDECAALSPDGVGFSFDYGTDGNGDAIQPPPHSWALFECATLAG